jgi:hypothetical protein
MKKLILIFLALSLLVLTTGVAFAHQPRIPEGNQIPVADPEISKAFYTKLEGKSHAYLILSDKPFALYVNILVPDIAGQKKDFKVEIVKNGDAENPVAILDGNNFEWKKFFEPFGYDSYLMGPEYKADASAGMYEIKVSSGDNFGKYSLAVGEAEAFNFQEVMNALRLIPEIKRDFFEESPAGFIFSPFGWGLVLVMFVLSFVFGLVYRFLLRKIARGMNGGAGSKAGWVERGAYKNIGTGGRLIRVGIGVGLFVWAITTSWNPVILFFSGFCFFEAIFSWCGLYAAIGKNSCPIR